MYRHLPEAAARTTHAPTCTPEDFEVPAVVQDRWEPEYSGEIVCRLMNR
jgi:hypothetical protein